MPRRWRARRKKGSGGARPRPRTWRRRVPRSIGGVDRYHSSSDEDYVAAEDDDSESSDEAVVAPRGSSDEESFEFSDSSGEEEDAAASKRGKARKRPRVSAGVSRRRRKSSARDPDDEEDDEDFLLDEEFEEEKSPAVAGKKMKIERKRKPDETKSKRPDETKSKRKRTNSASAARPAPVRKRSRRTASLSDDDEDFIVEDSAAKQTKKAGRKTEGRKKTAVDAELLDFIVSDDDLVAKDLSDSDFMVSEDDSIWRGRQQNKRGTAGKKNAASKSRRAIRLADSDFDLDEELIVLGSSTPQKKTVGKGGKGKEKVEDKGKEKVPDVSEKQVCGICLSEEQKATVRGMLDCCTHYYCFACIMEWSKVESRCPICKRRFTTISKPTVLSSGLGSKKAFIRVKKKDQVYQPSEEEVRGFIDPYANVVCIVCQEGGHDNLMLLCDICDSSAHTYCVGLGRTVPEGNWYCDVCMAVDNGESNSQGLDAVSDQGTSSSDLFYAGAATEELSTVMRANTDSQQEGFVCLQGSSQIELNVSPRNIQVDDSGVACQASGSRLSVPSGSHTHNQRHVLSSDSGLRQPEDLFSRTLSSPVQSTTVGQGTSSSNLFSSGIKSQDTGTDMHATNSSRSSLTFPGQSSSQRIDLNASSSHLSREDHGVASQTSGSGASTLSGRRAIHRHIHSLLSYVRPRQPDVTRHNLENDVVTSEVELRRQPLHTSEPLNPSQTLSATDRHRHISRHISHANENRAPYMFSEGVSLRHVEGAKEQVQSMVKRHLKDFSRDISLDRERFKDIARRSTHTILAACGIEHNRRIIATSIQPPGNCCHDRDVVPSDMIKDCCSSCFDSFVRDVVHNLIDTTR